MIKIKIKHNKQKTKNRLRPVDLHGLPYGQFYIMLSDDGCSETPSYFMTTGYNDGSILFWWDVDEETYSVAPADLDGYAKHVYVERIEANLVMELKICR
jgi:hypothetical protein